MNWKLSKKVINEAIVVAVFSVLYVLIGNARSIHENPFIPGAVIAVSMIAPVLAGILFGKRVGFFVGIIGTTLNYFSPAGSIFELLSIIPHGIMGLSAGYLKERFATPLAALALVVGHALNTLAYISFDLIPKNTLSNPQFWSGILYEIFVGVIAVTLITSIYRLGSDEV
jgi:uncharacterized membrane protein